MNYEGTVTTHAWLNENAPVGTVVLDPEGVDFVRVRDTKWLDGPDSRGCLLTGVYEGYKIIRWGDPWDDLEWVDEE